ncbi:MFS transporter [Halioxenophilus aromaticivorans]|uniref:MFS transporter n=1 Tax=Halioxenophilus aromaticivorans TaxID=1306992 RepID=A0AAV3UB98_9ALTE
MQEPKAPAFHGWKIVYFSCISQFFGMGFSIYLFGLFIQPMALSLGTSAGKIAWGMGIFYLVNALFGLIVGVWLDKGHAKKVMTLGSLLFAASLALLSVVSHPALAAVICALLFAPGACMISVLPCSTLVVNWFHQKQGLALGIAALGISLGGFLMPPITSFLIENYGWRAALQCLAAAIVLILTPLAWWLVIARPSDLNQQPDGLAENTAASQPKTDADGNHNLTFASLIRNRIFWLLTFTVGLLSMGSIIIITFIVPYAREIGLDTLESALLVSSFAGASFTGKFVFGWLSDVFSKRSVMVLLQVIAMFAWLPLITSNHSLLILASVVGVGLAVGGLTPIWASLIALYFGTQAFARVKGAMTLAMLICTIIPGPMGGLLFDATGSYAGAFQIALGLLPLGLLSTILLPKLTSRA